MTQITESFEVSPHQEQLWLAQPDGPSGRIQATLRLEGALDAATLREALRATIARHEILRTTFVRQPGIRVPLQVVAPVLAPEWSARDFGALGEDEQARELQALGVRELEESLDLASGPLLRAALVTLAPSHHVLLLTASALVADAPSLTELARELIAHYAGTAPGVEDPLQYADFAAWQRELRGGEEGEAQSAAQFWAAAEELTGSALPFAGSVSGSAVPGRSAVELDSALTERLGALGDRYGVKLSSVVLAAWQAVLARSIGEDELTIGLLAADRRHDDLQGAIGIFGRPVPLHARIDPRATFAEVLGAAELAAQQACVWQDYTPASATLPAVGFVCADGLRVTAGGLVVTLDRVVLGGAGLGAWLTCVAGAGQLSLSIDYDRTYLDPDSAGRLARRLERLLHSAANDAGAAVGELELLGSDERESVLSWGAGGPTIDATPVPERFASHAAGVPSRTAVIDEHGTITYGELERRANQLAVRLRRAGVGTDVPVALCTDRSIEMVVGLLGILKAGGAYVPLHHEHPPARLAHQCGDAGVRVVVAQQPLLARLPPLDAEVICLDRDRDALDAEPATPVDGAVTPDSLAYVIYTSGSTGTPKGVAVTHGNLANYASVIAHQLGAAHEPLSFGMVTSISTDLGNTSVFGALASGGTLVLVSPVAAADSSAMARQLERSPIDALKITPSHLAALLAGGDRRVLPRRWLVLGGERAPWDLVTTIRSLSDCEILNHYGPTETTIGCCTHRVGDHRGPYAPGTVPIGRPIAGDCARVLDAFGALAPVGAPGRLHIGGAGVARGYVGAPELTDARFVPDRFATGPAARMYDTGDVARWLPDGNLEFLGRVDEQVKIRGYRVEPAELESALRTRSGIADAAVVARPAAAGDLRLIAYCAGDHTVDPARLRAQLAEWLPEFMLPSAIVVLDALPRTPSGKVDRLALPDPDDVLDGDRFVAPRTPVEQAVADVWARVLDVERVGVDDDFFALGGHSLLATQVVAQVRSDFGVELPLHSLFTFPTVASLAAEITAMMGQSDEEETARLMAELEGLTDEEAERLLAGDGQPPEA